MWDYKEGEEKMSLTLQEKIDKARDILEAIDVYVNPREFLSLAEECKVKPANFAYLARVVKYIIKRGEGLSRTEAIVEAYPEYAEKSYQAKYDKAKRVELSNAYKVAINTIHTSLNTLFFFDRLSVLTKALELSLDDRTPIKHRYNYMKLFLEETRKSEEAKVLEMNINIGENTKAIEEKLDDIARKLEGKNAEEIIKVIVDDTR